MKCCAKLAPRVSYTQIYYWSSADLDGFWAYASFSSLLFPILILSPGDPVSKSIIIALLRENALILPSLCVSNWKSGWWAVLSTPLWYRSDWYWSRSAVSAHPQHVCSGKTNEKCVGHTVLRRKEAERSWSATAPTGAAEMPVCHFPCHSLAEQCSERLTLQLSRV